MSVWNQGLTERKRHEDIKLVLMNAHPVKFTSVDVFQNIMTHRHES